MLWYQQNQLSQWLEVLVNLEPPPSIANPWEQHHLWKIHKKHVIRKEKRIFSFKKAINLDQVDMILSANAIATSQNAFVPMNSGMFHISSKHIASTGNNNSNCSNPSSKKEVNRNSKPWHTQAHWRSEDKPFQTLILKASTESPWTYSPKYLRSKCRTYRQRS